MNSPKLFFRADSRRRSWRFAALVCGAKGLASVDEKAAVTCMYDARARALTINQSETSKCSKHYLRAKYQSLIDGFMDNFARE